MKFSIIAGRSAEKIRELLKGKLIRPLNQEEIYKLCKVPFAAAHELLSEMEEGTLLTPLGAFHKYERPGYAMVIPNKGRTSVPAKPKIRFMLCRTSSKK